MAEHKHVTIEERGEYTVVRFNDHWINDFFQIAELGQELYNLVECDHRQKIVLDLSNVDFLSSAALGKLISLNGRAKARHGRVVLCALRPQVRETLLTCKLDALLEIRASVAEAAPVGTS